MNVLLKCRNVLFVLHSLLVEFITFSPMHDDIPWWSPKSSTLCQGKLPNVI